MIVYNQRYSQFFLIIVTTTLTLSLTLTSSGTAADDGQCLKENAVKTWSRRNDKSMPILSYFPEAEDFNFDHVDSTTKNSSTSTVFLLDLEQDKTGTSRQLFPVDQEQITPWGLIQGFGYFQANTGHHPQFLTEPSTTTFNPDFNSDENDSEYLEDDDDFFTFQSQLAFYTCIFQGGRMRLFGISFIQGVGHFQCFVQGTGPTDILIFYQTLDFYQFNFQGVRQIQGFRNVTNSNVTAGMMEEDDFSFLFPVEAEIPGGRKINKRRRKMKKSKSSSMSSSRQENNQNMMPMPTIRQPPQQQYMQFFSKSTMNLVPVLMPMSTVEVGGVYQYFMNMNNSSNSNNNNNNNIFERKDRDGGFFNMQATDSRRRIFLQDLLSSTGHLQYNLRGQRGGAQSLVHGQYNFFQEMTTGQSFNFRATARNDDLGVNTNVGFNSRPPVGPTSGSRPGPGPGFGLGFGPQPPSKYLQVIGQYQNRFNDGPPSAKIINGVGRIAENLRILLMTQFSLEPRLNISNLPLPDFVQIHGHYSYNFRNFQRRPGGLSFDGTALYHYELHEQGRNTAAGGGMPSPVASLNTFLSPREDYFQGGATLSFTTGTGTESSSTFPQDDRINLRFYTTFTIFERTQMRNFGHLQFQGRWEHDFTQLRRLGLGGTFRIQSLGQLNAPIVVQNTQNFAVATGLQLTSTTSTTDTNITFEQWLRRIQVHGYIQLYFLYYLDLNRLGLLPFSRGVSRIDLTVIFHQDRRQAGVRLPSPFPFPLNNSTTTNREEEKRSRIQVTQYLRFQLFFNYRGNTNTNTRRNRGYTQLIFEYYLDL